MHIMESTSAHEALTVLAARMYTDLRDADATRSEQRVVLPANEAAQIDAQGVTARLEQSFQKLWLHCDVEVKNLTLTEGDKSLHGYTVVVTKTANG